MDTVAWAVLAFVTLTHQPRSFNTLYPEHHLCFEGNPKRFNQMVLTSSLTFKHNSAVGLIREAV